MKKFMLRWIDTIMFGLNAVLLLVLIVLHICLMRDVRNVEAVLNEMEDTRLRVTIEDVTEADKSDERLPGDDVEAQWPRLYHEDDAIALAKLVWGEARGVPDNGIVSAKCQQAAVIWTVLNRYDAGYDDNILGVITAPNQFVGYDVDHPVDDELLGLAYDVLDEWNKERHGETDVDRVIPADYLYFGGDGTYNHFRNEYNSNETWNWELADPYMGECSDDVVVGG